MFEYNYKHIRFRQTHISFGIPDPNLEYKTIKLDIKLTELDLYPLFEFSNLNVNYDKAIEKFPDLKNYFDLLTMVKKVRFNFLRSLQSICLIDIAGNKFLRMLLVFPFNNSEKLQKVFRKFGINPLKEE